MKISNAFDRFEAALKSMRAAEIAALGAEGPENGGMTRDVVACQDKVRAAAVGLWALPARGPSDLVLKARALRWHFPEGVEIEATTLGAAQEPRQEISLGALAIHYIVRDLLALSE